MQLGWLLAVGRRSSKLRRLTRMHVIALTDWLADTKSLDLALVQRRPALIGISRWVPLSRCRSLVANMRLEKLRTRHWFMCTILYYTILYMYIYCVHLVAVVTHGQATTMRPIDVEIIQLDPLDFSIPLADCSFASALDRFNLIGFLCGKFCIRLLWGPKVASAIANQVGGWLGWLGWLARWLVRRNVCPMN